MALLEGKVALVTGAAVGLGRAIAVAYGREGARVIVNYSKSFQEAQETAELVKQAGGEPWLIQADVSQDGQVRSMVAETIERFGRLDLLVNNAGIIAVFPFADLEAMTDEVWDTTFDVNVKGTFLCCRAVVEPMRRQSQGRIINLASVAGLRPRGSSIAYSTSKAAVIHLSKCLAGILGPEIQVNVIAPGYIADTRTNENRPQKEATLERMTKDAALKRVGKAEEVADVALFLATRGGFMTGSVMVVDGGRAYH
jgi:3-oxoacyl-[acyl-carrier protein] reductase